VHVTKNGNAEWLAGRIDESSMMADAKLDGEMDKKTAV
jgi:hypothetical protein